LRAYCHFHHIVWSARSFSNTSVALGAEFKT
jgi:hypothetical protein